MIKRRWQPGVYAIIDASLVTADAMQQGVTDAIAGGAVIIQYRDKLGSALSRRRNAQVLKAVCRKNGVPFIINDDVTLALDIGADGVHLGCDDMQAGEARARLGAEAIVGVSCYNDLARAREAQSAGADYVAFGRFFPSRTKPDAVQANTELLLLAKRELRVPLVAIGGITPENGSELIAAGADMLAVIQGIFGQDDVYRATLGYSRLFDGDIRTANPKHFSHT